jgi:hypothetical protein
MIDPEDRDFFLMMLGSALGGAVTAFVVWALISSIAS